MCVLGHSFTSYNCSATVQSLVCVLLLWLYWRHIAWSASCLAPLRPTSQTTQVSIRNTQRFRTAQSALMEPGTLWWRNTHCPSPRRHRALNTSLPHFTNVYAQSEWHMYHTLRRGCSYVEALDTTPGDVSVFLRPSATFHPLHYCYMSDAALSRYEFSFEMLSLITIQSSLRIHRLSLHLLWHYCILQVWNILCNCHTV
jgi:hypothetical protein